MVHTRKRRLIAALATIGALCFTLAGCADRGGGEDQTSAGEASEAATPDYPTQDITMIVPYSPGGASDLSARTIAGVMEEELGVSIIVENRTGGGGSVGLSYLAGRSADGYTIGYLPVEVAMLGHSGYVIDPSEYDVLGQIVAVPATIAVPADSPYQTLGDLVDAAAAAPGEITVANSGFGGIWHTSMLALQDAAGVEFNPIPFDGGAPAVTAAIGNQVDAVTAGVSEVAQASRDGQLRILAVFNDEPVESLPDVPTASEEGYEVTVGGWGAVGAPAGLPDGVADILADAVATAVVSEEYVGVIENAGNEPRYRDRDESNAFVAEQYSFFGDLLAE
ncbi:MAG: tripartite tricarboxylate transporter substrate binding protein [Beutenbergiaceae bacterium]